MAIAYKSFKEAKEASGSNSLTINKPAGVIENDLMVAVIDVRFASLPITSLGWTKIQGYDTFDVISIGVFYKIAEDSEPDNYTFNWTTPNLQAYGFIMCFDGHDTSMPINASGLTSGSSATPNCPSVTTDKDDCLILRIFGADHNDINVDGIPTGYPDGIAGITLDKSSDNAGSCSGGAAYLAQAIHGISGIAEFALTASEQWVAVTVAIQQAGAGSPSESPSPSASASPSSSVSPSPSQTASVSVSSSLSPSSSVSPSVSLSVSPSSSVSPSVSSSVSPSVSLSLSPSSSVSPSLSSSVSPSPTPSDVDTSGLPAYETGGTAQHVANEFTNLGHLIGETVTVFGTDVDGESVVYPDEVVDINGDISIVSEDPHAHNFVMKAKVGLRYRYILKPMRLDIITQQGTSKGSIGKFAEVVVSFHKSRGVKQGKDINSLHTITETEFTDDDLLTGDVVVSTDGGYSVEDEFVISGNGVYPCVVRAIVPRKKIIGR